MSCAVEQKWHRKKCFKKMILFGQDMTCVKELCNAHKRPQRESL